MDVLMHDDPHFRRFLREFQRLLPDYAASAAYLDVVGVGVKRIGKEYGWLLVTIYQGRLCFDSAPAANGHERLANGWLTSVAFGLSRAIEATL